MTENQSTQSIQSTDLPRRMSLMCNNSSSNGATGEASFMTLLQQAGVGGRGAKHSSKIVAAQLDDIISNFVSHQVQKMCFDLVVGEESQLVSGAKVIIIFSAYLFIIYLNLVLIFLLITFIRRKRQS